jgi:hypothetical protein
MASQAFDLQQEAEYVLGMMDMYQDDREIAGMLRMKGLSQEQVDKVLGFVRSEGFRKRIRQGRKIMLIGMALSVLLGVVWIFLFRANVYSTDDSYLERMNAKTIVGPVFYGLIIAIVQTIFGLARYVSYSRKLRRISTLV